MDVSAVPSALTEETSVADTTITEVADTTPTTMDTAAPSTTRPVATGKTDKAPASTTATVITQKRVLAPEEGYQGNNEEVEDLKKQAEEKDFSGEYGKRVYCLRHCRSMTPLKIIFWLGGRFPYTTTQQMDGTYLYKFNWAYPQELCFLLSTVIMFFTLFIGIWNMAHVSLNITLTKRELNETYQRQREHEEVLIQRYYILLIFIYSSLTHGCISAVLIIKKRNYTSHYLTFWSKAVYTMHMDVSKKARGFSVFVAIAYVICLAALTLLPIYKFGPSGVGFPVLFGDLTFRMLIPGDDWLISSTRTRFVVQIIGAVLLFLMFTASKSSVLFFIYHCKTLQSAFAYWNGRVYAAVLRGGEFAQTEEGRTTYRLLFKDHCILMDLMEGMDQVYAFSIESYFGCQVFSMFFELYFLIRTAKHGENQYAAAYPAKNSSAFFVRPYDWCPVLILMFMSTFLMAYAAKSAANTAEEAMAGLEVIRRKTMLGRKTDEELYFILSMFSSYTAYKKMEISAGGFYYMNKDFAMGLISAVLSYFIILYQFQPVMDISFPANGDDSAKDNRVLYGKFLAELEGLDDMHYETTTSNTDLWKDFRANA